MASFESAELIPRAPGPPLETGEPLKNDLAALIAEVAARYSEAVPLPPPPQQEPAAPESLAWQRGGINLFPEDDDGKDGRGDEFGESASAREQRLAHEVEELKKTLLAQQLATRKAEVNVAQLSEKLASTKDQVERSLKQVHGGQRARIERAESSVAQLKTEMHQAQRNLETERRARRAEAVVAAARMAEAEQERSSIAAAQTQRDSHGPSTLQVRIGVTAAASFAAVAALLLYWGFGPAVVRHAATPSAKVNAVTTASAAIPGSSQPVALRLVESESANPAPVTGDKNDFSQSMDRLTKALSAFPGVTPQEVLRQISLTGKASECAFNWNNGNPALVYSGGKFSMAEALNRCAAAVEKFR